MNFKIWICLLTFTLSGCAYRSQTTITRIDPVDAVTRQNIISSLNANTLLLENMKANITLTVHERSNRQEVRGYLRFKRPDKLRVGLLGALNELRAMVVVNGDDFLMLFVQEREAIAEKISDNLLRRVFDVDVRVPDIRAAILANPIFGVPDENLEVGRINSGDYLVRFQSDGNREEVVVGDIDSSFIVEKWNRFGESGELVQELRFGDYMSISGVPRPHKVEVSRPREGSRTVLDISDMEINVDVPDSLFSVTVPPGVTIRSVEQ